MTLIAKLSAIATAISDILSQIPAAEIALTDFSTFLDTV
jgi:hypothetical protein